MMTEDNILQLPKRNNYHYNVEYVDGAECVVIYYRLSDNMWNRHVEYCREYGFENNTKQWLKVFIDIKDFEMINGWSIKVNLKHLQPKCGNKASYMQLQVGKKINKKQIQKSFHRYFINPPKDKQVDHINYNTLDNRRCNLRLVTAGENNQNKDGSQLNSKTGIRGVSIYVNKKRSNRKYYRARVMLYKKNVFEKLFPFTPQGLIDAEKAVIEARLKYFTHNELDKAGINND